MPELRDVTAIRSVQHDYYPTILITCLMNTNYDDPKPSQEQLVFIRSYIQSLSRQGITDVISVNPPKVKEIDYTRRGLALSRHGPGSDACSRSA